MARFRLWDDPTWLVLEIQNSIGIGTVLPKIIGANFRLFIVDRIGFSVLPGMEFLNLFHDFLNIRRYTGVIAGQVF